MKAAEWTRLVNRLNAAYPGQQLPPESAAEWYRQLASVDAAVAGEAVTRCQREHIWMPSLAQLLDAVREVQREQADARRHHQQARAITASGRPAPPEFTRARRLLTGAVQVDGGHDGVRAEIERLADALERRQQRGQE